MSNNNSNEGEDGGILNSLLGGDQTTVALAAAAGVAVLATALFLVSSSSSSSKDTKKKAPPPAAAAKAKAKSAAPASSAAAGGGGGGGRNKGKKKKKSKAPKTAEPEPKLELEPEPAAEPKAEAAPPAATGGKAKRKRKKKNKPANNGGNSAGNTAAAAAAPAAAANTSAGTGGTDTTDDAALAQEMQQQINAEAGASSPTASADDGWAVAGEAAKKKKKKAKKKKPAAAPKAEEVAPAAPAATGSEANKGATEAAAAPAKAQTSVTVQIDANKVGIVIGKNGSTMQKIEAALDVKIDINAPARDDPNPSPTATVIITADEGNTGGIARAKSAVKELCTKGYSPITEAPGFAEQYVSVHPKYLAEIVGKGGKNIKALQQALEIKISIPKTDYNPREKQVGKVPNCRVGIAGPRENCVAGKKAIQELVRYHHTSVTHPGWTHEEKDVPQEFFHCIIGRGGAEVKHIRGNFQVEVHLPNEDSHCDNVLVVGAKQANVDRALAHIDTLIERDTEQRERKYNDDVDDEAWEGDAGDDSAW